MAKTLKTKRRFAYFAHLSLKGTPPKDFPTIEEMELTVEEILPALREEAKGYNVFRERADEVSTKLASGDMSSTEVEKVIKEINIDATKFENEHRLDEIKIELENSTFNTFFQQFERWGKEWFLKLEDFIEFRKAMNDTNKESGKSEKEDEKK